MNVGKALDDLIEYIDRMKAVEHTGLGLAMADKLIDHIVDGIEYQIPGCSDDVYWWLYAEPKIYHYKSRRYEVPTGKEFHSVLKKIYRVADGKVSSEAGGMKA